jgi:hypothetical protein
MYYTGLHPYTLEKVYTAKEKEEKLAQRQFFFWYKGEYRNQITRELRKMNRPDLIDRLFDRNSAERSENEPMPHHATSAHNNKQGRNDYNQRTYKKEDKASWENSRRNNNTRKNKR